VDLGLFVLRFPASGQLLDPVQALIDELDVKLDPLIGIGLVVANLLDLVVGQRIVLVLGEKLWGESGGDQEEKNKAGNPAWHGTTSVGTTILDGGGWRAQDPFAMNRIAVMQNIVL
jgi:hypothetical protein